MCPTIVPYMREVKKDKAIYFTSLLKNMKVLVATEKPFAKKAVDGIRTIIEEAGYELALLEKYTDKAQLLAAVADADALIIRSDKVTAEVLDAAKNLKIVVRAGAGYDNVDLAAATAHNVVVMNTPGQNSNAVAELALGMMVFMARNQFNPGTGSELQGKTLAIHAYGNVGKLVGRKGKALGMNVIAFDPFITDAKVFEADGVQKVDSIEELYAKADYLSLHIPATEQTKKSIGRKLLTSMPKGATLVNTARKEDLRGRRDRGHDRARGPEVHHRHRPRGSGRDGREVRQAFLRYAQEDGCRDRRGQHQCRSCRCASDRGLREERQHAFPGKQVENREPIHTSW